MSLSLIKQNNNNGSDNDDDSTKTDEKSPKREARTAFRITRDGGRLGVKVPIKTEEIKFNFMRAFFHFNQILVILVFRIDVLRQKFDE